MLLWFEALVGLLLLGLQILPFNAWIQTNLNLLQSIEHRVCHEKWTLEYQHCQSKG